MQTSGVAWTRERASASGTARKTFFGNWTTQQSFFPTRGRRCHRRRRRSRRCQRITPPKLSTTDEGMGRSLLGGCGLAARAFDSNWTSFALVETRHQVYTRRLEVYGFAFDEHRAALRAPGIWRRTSDAAGSADDGRILGLPGDAAATPASGTMGNTMLATRCAKSTRELKVDFERLFELCLRLTQAQPINHNIYRLRRAL